MLCNVKNMSNRIRALESAEVGIMVFIPANSDGEYNLSPSALALANLTLIVAPVESTEIVADEPSLALPPVPVAQDPEPLSPAQALEPSKASPANASAKEKQPDADAPADWQKGLEAQK